MRAKFRNSWKKPEALIPGKLTEVNFDMPDLDHTFRRGHRIMMQVQSSWVSTGGSQSTDFREHPARETGRLQSGHGAALSHRR
jgi:uncharacterized protein